MSRRQPKFVKIAVKHDDRATIHLLDSDKQKIDEHDGGMPYVGIFGGDYTKLLIDNASGLIIGWKPIERLKSDH
jgi:hypothetical protein